MVVVIGERTLHVGLKGSRRCLSPLHTELEALVWAMKSLGAIPMTDVLFVKDCSDLIAMTSNPGDWPAFASELKDFLYYKDLLTSCITRIYLCLLGLDLFHVVRIFVLIIL